MVEAAADLPSPNHSRGREISLAVGAAALSAILFVIAFPPFNVAEAAYVFAVPLLLWLFRPRPVRWTAAVVLGWGFVSWLVLIVWLRHVTMGGYIVLSGVLAGYFSAWFWLAWRWLPRLRDAGWPHRVAGMFALASAWAVLEYVRTFFLSGFPWLPLAASHWERPLLLQLAAWTGSYGVSFVLILFNLGLAFYIDRLVRYFGRGWQRFCPEFFVAFAVVLLAAFGGFRWSQAQAGERERLFNVALVQPYIPQDLKWDPAKADSILQIIARTTLMTRSNELQPDLVVGPEAVTPYPLLGSPGMQNWMEELAREMGAPLLVGAIGVDRGEEDDWFNGAFAIDPILGLLPEHYRKRKLVPYGEYVPLESFLPWLSKIVPLEGSFSAGTSAAPITMEVAGRTLAMGVLICYEDVFPRLARESALAGAEILVVVTNNGWYGEEGMPYQHAAHSVLRAVETRRPVLRSGNGGWSGWIDEYGVIREVLTDERGSVFFRGAGVYPISRDAAWVDQQSFYVRHGDWFVAASALCVVVFGLAIEGRSLRRRRG